MQNERLDVVGLASRFPGGADPTDGYWTLLSEGRDAIVEVPEQRWNLDRVYDPDPTRTGKMYVREGGFLRAPIDEFDAQFFRISPREAAGLDPQQRLLLEVGFEALEDAGIPLDAAAGLRAGVFIGGFCLDNQLLQLATDRRDRAGIYTASSSTMALLSNRVSYVFDLKGPSLTVDTACSSSLVAMHLACQSIWNHDSDLV